MQFQPKTEEELALSQLLQEGIYPFEVVNAEDKVSKSGNEMIKLKLKIFADDFEQTMFDYLLESMAFKLRHAAINLGIGHLYQQGRLQAFDFIGKQGYVKIGVEKANGEYGPKNKVVDYVSAGNGVSEVSQSKTEQTNNTAEDKDGDDIPF